MTTIPNLPTDNLYKFLALFGMALILLPSIYLYNEISNFRHMEVELHQAYALDSTEDVRVLEGIMKSNERIDKLLHNVDTLSQAIKETKKWTPELRQYYLNNVDRLERYIYPELDKEFAKFNKDSILTDRSRNHIELQAQTEKVLAAVDSLNKLKWLCLLAIAMGIALTYYGFKQWYHRVQKHQDIILASEARKLSAQIHTVEDTHLPESK